MKKNFFILFILFVGIFATGCTKQVVFVDKNVNDVKHEFDNYIKTTYKRLNFLNFDFETS